MAMANKDVNLFVANPHTKNMIRRLSFCSMLPGSWDKRFVRDMLRQVTNSGLISQKQQACVDKLAHKYRRQIGYCLCLECLNKHKPTGQYTLPLSEAME